jgi:hypothetical protein
MRRKSATDLPDGFGISLRVRKWANLNNFNQLEAHFEYFMLKVEANGYQYCNWDSALMTAIRDDWAKLRVKKNGSQKLTDYAKERGIEARIGETMEAFERRIMESRH